MLPTLATASDPRGAALAEGNPSVTAPLSLSYDPAMPISFEDARQIAAATLSALWNYAVEIEPHGREDEHDFIVLVRHDVELLGGPLVLVTKADGSVNFVPYLADPDRWEAMAPAGAPEQSTV
jgi:hypothetical protein